MLTSLCSPAYAPVFPRPRMLILVPNELGYSDISRESLNLDMIPFAMDPLHSCSPDFASTALTN